MENQNSVAQEKKKFFSFHGKKKKIIIGGVVVLLLIGISGRGFAFHRARGHHFMGIGNATVAVKDFKSLGIVFAKSDENTRDGYRATYNALMNEAAQKGADAIINVNISSTGKFFNRTWSGSATAIQYLDVAPGDARKDALWMFDGRGFGRKHFQNVIN